MSIEEYFGKWLRVINKEELKHVLGILEKEYKKKVILPSQSEVFRAFNLCPYDSLKIVMLGQDPYPQKGVATGILFGNRKETEEINLSPSLQIIKEAVINFEIPHNFLIFDSTLESWAKQGILMLNSALTVELNQIGSHTMLWRPFISKLLNNLSNRENAIVYVLFGSQAKTFKPYINKLNNYIIEVEHPAYFARTNTKMPSRIFSDINYLMKKIYGTTINWYEEY